MVFSMPFGVKQLAPTSSLFVILVLLSSLIACDEPEPIEPPSSPYDRAAIEANVLSPNGDLLAIEPESIGAIVSAVITGDGQSPVLFMNRIFDLIDSVSELDETTQQGLTVAQHALRKDSTLEYAQHAISVAAQTNAWVELRVKCGQTSGESGTDGGTISLTVLATTDSDVSGLRPVGIAWGTALNCMLWTDDSNTVVDGDFAVVLPEGRTPTLFKFVGSLTSTETTNLDYEGYATDLFMGVVIEENNSRFIVATSPDTVVINDCHGQWSCDQEASRCAYTADVNDGFTSTCTEPNVSEVTW